jgi:hypothetical protein
MADLSRYREQHAALVKGIGAIQRLARPAELSTRAPELLRLLMELAGQLKLHLALEDESLYPKLVKATDPKTAEIARRFQREMGGLRRAFEAFLADWSTVAKLQADPARFVEAWGGIVKALGARVEREEKELYSLAEKL